MGTTLAREGTDVQPAEHVQAAEWLELIAEAERYEVITGERADTYRRYVVVCRQQFERHAPGLRRDIKRAQVASAHYEKVEPIRRRIVRAVRERAARVVRSARGFYVATAAREHRVAPSRRRASTSRDDGDSGPEPAANGPTLSVEQFAGLTAGLTSSERNTVFNGLSVRLRQQFWDDVQARTNRNREVAR
ncbi:hypothetical protein [Capillimicrobium parvum]|uniref:hypothetical protein n=1 Tax=Capillimicrobium parvum TaxID=2884022 RepID=UPI00216B47E8|nr:hypothetical protein [Capillimicrobium parvum]